MSETKAKIQLHIKKYEAPICFTGGGKFLKIKADFHSKWDLRHNYTEIIIMVKESARNSTRVGRGHSICINAITKGIK
jgi:hypothetical protein